MPGEGSMLHALISMKNNKRNRIDKFKRLTNTSNETSEFIDHKKASPQLLASIKAKMIVERQLAHKRLLFKIFLFCIVMMILLYIFNHNWRWIENFFYKVK